MTSIITTTIFQLYLLVVPAVYCMDWLRAVSLRTTYLYIIVVACVYFSTVCKHFCDRLEIPLSVV